MWACTSLRRFSTVREATAHSSRCFWGVTSRLQSLPVKNMLSARARSLSNFFHVSNPTPLLIEWKSMRAVLRVVSFRASSMRYPSVSRYSTSTVSSPFPVRGDRMVKIERYAAKGVWDPPTYSQAVKVTGPQPILYLAGQVSYDDKGGPAHRGDFKAQARAVFQAIKAQVEAGGGHGGTNGKNKNHPTYLTDIRNRADLGPIREEFLGKKTCASTLVGVAALAMPEWLIEIEAIAIL